MFKDDEITCKSFKMRNTLYFNVLNIPIIVIRESEEMGNTRYHHKTIVPGQVLRREMLWTGELRAEPNVTHTVHTRLKHFSSNNKGCCFAPSSRNV